MRADHNGKVMRGTPEAFAERIGLTFDTSCGGFVTRLSGSTTDRARTCGEDTLSYTISRPWCRLEGEASGVVRKLIGRRA